MAKRTLKEIQTHVEGHGGSIVTITNGNYNIRKNTSSANIGKPTGNKFDDAQLQRAWTETGIPKMR